MTLDATSTCSSVVTIVLQDNFSDHHTDTGSTVLKLFRQYRKWLIAFCNYLYLQKANPHLLITSSPTSRYSGNLKSGTPTPHELKN
ncbi:hypothetical protein J6590_076852 [Homalodisca vitripennis]|nr:hypothetical protein J6590_076852 [Homalodisca vitripennis]